MARPIPSKPKIKFNRFHARMNVARNNLAFRHKPDNTYRNHITQIASHLSKSNRQNGPINALSQARLRQVNENRGSILSAVQPTFTSSTSQPIPPMPRPSGLFISTVAQKSMPVSQNATSSRIPSQSIAPQTQFPTNAQVVSQEASQFNTTSQAMGPNREITAFEPAFIPIIQPSSCIFQPTPATRHLRTGMSLACPTPINANRSASTRVAKLSMPLPVSAARIASIVPTTTAAPQSQFILQLPTTYKQLMAQSVVSNPCPAGFRMTRPSYFHESVNRPIVPVEAVIRNHQSMDRKYADYAQKQLYQYQWKAALNLDQPGVASAMENTKRRDSPVKQIITKHSHKAHKHPIRSQSKSRQQMQQLVDMARGNAISPLPVGYIRKHAVELGSFSEKAPRFSPRW